MASSANGSLAAGGHLKKKQFLVQSHHAIYGPLCCSGGGVARPRSFDVSQDFKEDLLLLFFFKVIVCSFAHLQECFPDVA